MTRTLKTAFVAAILAGSATFAMADNANFADKAAIYSVARMSTGMVEGRNSADLNAIQSDGWADRAEIGRVQRQQPVLVEGRNALALPQDGVIGHDPAGNANR